MAVPIRLRGACPKCHRDVPGLSHDVLLFADRTVEPGRKSYMNGDPTDHVVCPFCNHVSDSYDVQVSTDHVDEDNLFVAHPNNRVTKTIGKREIERIASIVNYYDGLRFESSKHMHSRRIQIALVEGNMAGMNRWWDR